jgi:uncharacterized membrane protein YheB (UPF0754 family)
MNINVLAGPIIGSVIGYCTNYVAVKMLVRPLRPIKLGNYTLPFTPGIIPKGKKRLAKAIGNAVGGTLLTDEALKAALLSEEMKDKVQKDAKDFWEKQRQNETTVKETALRYVKEEEYDTTLENAENLITDKIVEKLSEMDVGEIIAREGIKAIKQKISGSFLGMIVNDSIIESMSAPVVEAINDYVNENGQVIVYGKVSEECDKFSNSQIKNVLQVVDSVDAVKVFMKCYNSFVENELGKVIAKIDIAAIIENKIDEMDVLELEELILSVMKKELGAVVNLGAVIGFVIGIINIFF